MAGPAGVGLPALGADVARGVRGRAVDVAARLLVADLAVAAEVEVRAARQAPDGALQLLFPAVGGGHQSSRTSKSRTVAPCRLTGRSATQRYLKLSTAWSFFFAASSTGLRSPSAAFHSYS